MKYRIRVDAPRNLVTNREDIPLGVEMLWLADFPEVDDRHDADVERQQRFALLATGFSWGDWEIGDAKHQRNGRFPGSSYTTGLFSMTIRAPLSMACLKK